MAGGIDWFRWHHGSVTDPKFQLVAKKAGVRLGDVIAVWAFVLEKASADADRGAIGPIDFETLDFLLGTDDGAAARILDAMTQRGLIEGSRVAKWEERQPKKEDDTANERKRRQREREHAERMATLVTGDESPDVTPSHADVTPRHAREEERREEDSPSLRSGEGRSRAPALPKPDDVTDQTWGDWLRLRKSKRAPVTGTVLDGARAEAMKAGIPLQRFLEIWCMRGSQGLQAEWIRADERGAAPRGPARSKFSAAAAGVFGTPSNHQEVIDV